MNIPILNQPVKPKVTISIILDDAGRIGMQTSSQNIVTNLGLLKMAEHMMLNKQIVQREENEAQKN